MSFTASRESQTTTVDLHTNEQKPFNTCSCTSSSWNCLFMEMMLECVCMCEYTSPPFSAESDKNAPSITAVIEYKLTLKMF